MGYSALNIDLTAHAMLKPWNPIVKLTILGGHELPLAPKILAYVVQNFTLNDSCGYLGDLCVSVVPSRNAMFHYTFKHTTAKWLLSCFRTCQNRVTYITCRSAAAVAWSFDGIFT